MSFNSVGFLIFLPVVVLVHYLLPHKVRWVWLLLASYFFYMTWQPEMAALIFTVSLTAYLGGLAAGHFKDVKNNAKAARIAAGISCAVCLGFLVFFKYFGFLAENINRLAALGGGSVSVPDIVLPVGISFFAFQAVGYIVDVARGSIKAEKHFGYFALFVSFFPQLVAGPIEKATDLLPRLREKKTFSKENLYSGLGRILVGFFKKIAVADMLAAPVNAIFDDPQKAGSALTALGAVMFAVQIFCDFSGYTDIAIGAAEILGVKLSKNFDKPYAAVSLNDFWRRWHISLSGWFRDYVYIPLGGSRKGVFRTYLNLMAVFLLSGFWHGAAWHFVAWGVLHGLFSIIERVTLPLRNKIWEKMKVKTDGGLVVTLRRIATFVCVCFLWIFFRAGNIGEAFSVIGTIFSFKAGDPTGIFEGWAMIAVALASVAALVVIDSGRIKRYIPFRDSWDEPRPEAEKYASPAAVILIIWAVALAWLLLSKSASGSAFIYFQF